MSKILFPIYAFLLLTVVCMTANAGTLSFGPDKPFSGSWKSFYKQKDGTIKEVDDGVLQAQFKYMGENTFELTMDIIDSSIFTPSGQPYSNKGIYVLNFTLSNNDKAISVSFKHPGPNSAYKFVPDLSGITYNTTLKGKLNLRNSDNWDAQLTDSDLTLDLAMKNGSLIGKYKYERTWFWVYLVKDEGSFELAQEITTKIQ